MKLDKDIAIWEGVLSHDECHAIIAHYEQLSKLNLSFTRIDLRDAPTHKKRDSAVFPLEAASLKFTPDSTFLNVFLERFWICYGQYTTHYSLLTEAASHQIRSMKIQKTLPSEGYHVWHFESDNADRASRVCAWGLYLNTIDEGGETEFLYQSKRVPAVEGSLVIWPATYTHAHRGNPPLSGEKYLLTGWIEY